MGKAVLSEKGGSIFLTFFGVPFFVIGILVLYFMALSPYLTLKDSASWPELNAEILDLKYTEKIQPLIVKYSYVYEGQSYVSSSLYLDTDFVFFESQNDAFMDLKEAFDGGHKVSVFVNPKNPQQSALFREFKDYDFMMAVFGGVFATVGFCIMLGGVLMYRSASRKEQSKNQNPDEPWMWHKYWRQGFSKPERKANLIAGFVFLCFWYGMTGILALVLNKELLDGGVAFHAVSGMAGLGLLFIYFYIKSILKFRKYGQSFLEILSLPGRPGKEFKGQIHAPFFLHPEGDIYFSVDCKHHYTEESGDSRRSKTEVLYEDKFSVDPDKARSLQEAYIIPVSFNIPKDKPDSSDSIIWTLNVYAYTTGLGWSETYKVPVYGCT